MRRGYIELGYAGNMRRHMITLEMRCHRGDLIEVHKILNGNQDLDSNKSFTITDMPHNTWDITTS
jgi:hypothetical protein